MHAWLADPPFFGGPGQGARQIIELFVAFGLTSLIGLEREIQGKSAGVRTQTIVGTAAALILLVSKYGFPERTRKIPGGRFDESYYTRNYHCAFTEDTLGANRVVR